MRNNLSQLPSLRRRLQHVETGQAVRGRHLSLSPQQMPPVSGQRWASLAEGPAAAGSSSGVSRDPGSPLGSARSGGPPH